METSTQLSMSTLFDMSRASEWSNLKTNLETVSRCLEGVEANMKNRTTVEVARYNDTGSGFFGGSSSAEQSSVVYLEPAQHLNICYHQLDITVAVSC